MLNRGTTYRPEGRASMFVLRPATERRSAQGASAVEYALLVAALAVVVFAITLGLASIVKDAFSSTTDCTRSGGAGTGCVSTSAP
jgi:pilus assembly protein Flp/PilA